MGESSVPSAKSRDQLKQFEEKEDCFILEFDPDGDLDISKLSLSHSAEADICVVAEKGQIACRDYPHPRHDCAKFPFGKTPNESHCELCYCYVCDFAAPCKKWGGRSMHCSAFDDDRWKIKRKLRREAVERKKEAFKDFEHPRHMCVKYPFGQTPNDSHCELCYCYVCESDAPCNEWVGTSSHCHAFNNQTWSTKRELWEARESQEKQSNPVSGASVTTAQHVQNNAIFPEGHQQDVQRSQSDVGASVEGGESTDELSTGAKVYVGNLPTNVIGQDLFRLFTKVGMVKEIRVGTGGFGFVTMGSMEEAEKAVEVLDGVNLNRIAITVKKAIPKTYSIYVGNLSPKVNDQHLKTLFTDHGFKVVSTQIALDRLTEQPRGFGFVVVSSETARQEAIKTLNGHVLDGRVLKLNLSYWG